MLEQVIDTYKGEKTASSVRVRISSPSERDPSISTQDFLPLAVSKTFRRSNESLYGLKNKTKPTVSRAVQTNRINFFFDLVTEGGNRGIDRNCRLFFFYRLIHLSCCFMFTSVQFFFTFYRRCTYRFLFFNRPPQQNYYFQTIKTFI